MIAKDKIRVKLFSFDVKILDQSAESIVKAVQKAKAQIKGPIPLPTKIKNILFYVLLMSIKSQESNLRCELIKGLLIS